MNKINLKYITLIFSTFLIFFLSACKKEVNKAEELDQYVKSNFKIDENSKYNETNTIKINSIEEFDEYVKNAKSSLLEINKEYKMSISNGNRYKIDGETYTLPAVNIIGINFMDNGQFYGGGSAFSTFNLYFGAQFNTQSNLFVTSQVHTSGAGSAIFSAQVIDSYNATESNGKRSMYITVKITEGVTIGGHTYGVVLGEFEYKVVKQTATTFYLYRLY